MSCKLCLEFNENSFEFTSTAAISRNIVEILRKHLSFCFKVNAYWWTGGSKLNLNQNNCFQDGDSEGVVCEKCWWKVEIFDNFYNSIEMLHQNTIFAEALIKFNQDNDTDVVKVEEPDCIITEQHVDKRESVIAATVYLSDDTVVRTRRLHSTANTRKRYTKSHSEKVQCDLCDAWLKNKYFFRDHYLSKHEQSKRCPKGRRSKLMSPQPPNPLIIRLEEIKNSSERCLERVTKFQCTEPDCPTTLNFTTQKQLDRHRRDMHSEVQCDICNKTYRNYYLAKHKKKVHSKKFETICDICGLRCKTKETYKAHYATMHTVQERIQCDICSLWLKNKNYFRNHYVTVHMGSDPVTCQTCGHIARSKRALVSHERIHRPDYKSFMCTVCGKSFSNKTRYRDHMSIHSNAREKIKCKTCCREFNSQSGFQVNYSVAALKCQNV